MAEEITRPRLEIVRAARRAAISAGDFQDPGPQANLFPVPKRGLLIFVYFPDVTEQEFRETLECAKPSFVLELRSAPRFDIGKLNRQLAFQAFQTQGSRYLDLTSATMGKRDQEGVVSSLRGFLQSARVSLERPVMFLVNSSESDEDFTKRILDTVSSYKAGFSEVYEVPRYVGSTWPSSR
jgi:hypothetical protein